MDRDSIRSAFSMNGKHTTCTVNGTEVRIRMLTAKEREDWEEVIASPAGKRKAGIRAELVVRAATDQDGKQIWDSAAEVAALPAAIVVPLFDAALKFNGMSQEAVEEMEGNSEAGTAGN